MYGHIHICLRDLVLSKLGREMWEEIRQKVGLEDSRDFLVFHNYPDILFYKLIDEVAFKLNISRDESLELFGKHFFMYAKRLGYHNMIKNLGADLKSFLNNLDALHEYFSITQKTMIPPSFSSDNKDDDNTLILHYNSSRKGLFPWLKGMLVNVAKEIFWTKIEVTALETNSDFRDGSRFKEHVLVQIKMLDRDGRRPSVGPTDFSDFRALYPDSSLVSSENFIAIFPYHLVFDYSLHVKQAGIMVQKLCPVLRDPNQVVSMPQISSLLTPAVPFTVEQIKRFFHSCFTLMLHKSVTSKQTEPHKGVLLKGQIYYMESNDNFFFMGSPRFMTISEMSEQNLYLSDLPLYDVTRELILVNEQRITELEISKHLDQTTRQLQNTMAELEIEKGKVANLLTEMLPLKVAKQLLKGQKVEAEKYDMVTILFSDIVTFTTIASHCSPMDIVSMLNALYSIFDKATEKNEVYKVETIGDAYMVVGGVPEYTDRHAELVANQAIDMILGARQVSSPSTGRPLEIRVGMHSGPVVAGVVGEKMPRFCLFGDSVNVASRMESHGLPGRIHVSPNSYNILKDKEFSFEDRGQMQIKGKGLMTTYFLKSSRTRDVPSPLHHGEMNGDLKTETIPEHPLSASNLNNRQPGGDNKLNASDGLSEIPNDTHKKHSSIKQLTVNRLNNGKSITCSIF